MAVGWKRQGSGYSAASVNNHNHTLTLARICVATCKQASKTGRVQAEIRPRRPQSDVVFDQTHSEQASLPRVLLAQNPEQSFAALVNLVASSRCRRQTNRSRNRSLLFTECCRAPRVLAPENSFVRAPLYLPDLRDTKLVEYEEPELEGLVSGRSCCVRSRSSLQKE